MIQITSETNMDDLPIFDPTEGPTLDSWFPANKASTALVVSLEACKDMIRLIDALDSQSPMSDTRGLTLLATPLMSFVDNMCMLNSLLAKEDITMWPEKDVKALKESIRILNRSRSGLLRKLRNKRSAHHDQDALSNSSGVPQATPDLFLPILCHGLRCIILFLNHGKAFWWTRSNRRDSLDRVTIFGEVATTFRLDEERKISDIVGVTIAKDPRYAAKKVIDRLIKKYNFLAISCSDKKYPQIRINS